MILLLNFILSFQHQGNFLHRNIQLPSYLVSKEEKNIKKRPIRLHLIYVIFSIQGPFIIQQWKAFCFTLRFQQNKFLSTSISKKNRLNFTWKLSEITFKTKRKFCTFKKSIPKRTTIEFILNNSIYEGLYGRVKSFIWIDISISTGRLDYCHRI